jgi:hypothetical protein
LAIKSVVGVVGVVGEFWQNIPVNPFEQTHRHCSLSRIPPFWQPLMKHGLSVVSVVVHVLVAGTVETEGPTHTSHMIGQIFLIGCKSHWLFVILAQYSGSSVGQTIFSQKVPVCVGRL